MPIANATSVTFKATGCSDTFDGTNSQPGAMAALTNLIPAPQTRDAWVGRPASTPAAAFIDFVAPMFVEALFNNGNRIYGFIQSGLNAGHSQPFIFDIATETFVAISGITGANTPVSTVNTGEWIPPTIDLVGGYVIFTHPGFDGATHFFGWLDMTGGGGTFAAPAWNAGNTATHALAAVPTAVAQYAGSACFAVNTTSPQSAAVVFSDAGNPLTVTNASQVITFQNGLPVTALKGMPLGAQITGGIVQSLMAFQGETAITQILGTPALTNVTLNVLNDVTGTQAPNTICTTPKGMLFAAHDGIRRIDQYANIKAVIGRRGQGITLPFIFAVNPSRMCAAYNEGVYRISVQNGNALNQPTQEWWYHEDDDLWTGPHTFPATVITATPLPHVFTMATQITPAALWDSAVVADTSASFVENGSQLTFLWQTALWPDNGGVGMNALGQTNVAVQFTAGQNMVVSLINDYGALLDQVMLVPRSTLSSGIWGEMLWGSGVWGASTLPLREVPVLWNQPNVFKQGAMRITGVSSYSLKLGNAYAMVERVPYSILVPDNLPTASVTL